VTLKGVFLRHSVFLYSLMMTC